MTIEIHEPELEAMIERCMASGTFQSVEDVLVTAMKKSEIAKEEGVDTPKMSLDKFLMQSPLRGSGLVVERPDDYPRIVEL